jgi:hypothetical protein
MNKIKAISALTVTLMSAAVTSTPASAQVNTQVFPTSMCQPADSISAKNLIFFGSGNIQSNGGGQVICPIPSNPLFSSFRRVVLRVKVTGPQGIRPSCRLVSFRLNTLTFFGQEVGSQAATLNTEGNTLVAVSNREDYYLASCSLPSGTKISSYSLQGINFP